MTSTVGAADAAPAPAPQPDTLASLAARMKAEIRGDLQRDLADATRRIRDKVPAAPAQAYAAATTAMGRACAGCAAGWDAARVTKAAAATAADADFR
jgi:hypothetical protein